MLAAYRGELPDTVPVAPEFWYYLPARLLGVDIVRFEREIPLWEALLKTFRHYQTEGWGAVFTSVPAPDVISSEKWLDLGGGHFEARTTSRTPHGEIASSQLYARDEPSWMGERPIKDFARDWPAFRALSMGCIESADWGPDKRRLILGSGDQVGRETPDENIAAMIGAGRRLGKCS